MNAPSASDVVVRQKIGNSATVYMLATHAGPNQFSFRSREEAVSRALGYATHAHVQAWFATGVDNFWLLGAFRTQQDTENVRGITMNRPSDSPGPASCATAAADSAIVTRDPTIADWSRLIRAEYFESPGLHLTRREVQRLWGLDPATCEAILAALIDARFLKRTQHGTYARAEQS
jgi:hypothetical protein